MTKLEKKLLDFVDNKINILFIIVISLLALFLRYKAINFESGDYTHFLSVWFDYLKDNGGLLALKNYPGDYNAPYMTLMSLLTYLPFNKIYLIKGLSILFDFALALSSALLVKEIAKSNKEKLFLLTYGIVLFLPTVFLNSSLWGQCDSIYATFCILALLYLMKSKYVRSFILLGIAFSFKLQFIFIVPIFIVYYFSKLILHMLTSMIWYRILFPAEHSSSTASGAPKSSMQTFRQQ